MERDKIDVYVGATRVCYVLPKTLLCEKSGYFRPAFTGGFEETRTGTSKLSLIETDTFQAIIKWMMDGVVESPSKGSDRGRSFVDDRIHLLPLTQIYLAAQFLNISELRKTAAKTFQDATVNNVSVSLTSWANPAAASRLIQPSRPSPIRASRAK